MNKVVSHFLDNLAERLAALGVGMLSTRLSSLHAADQAEQQSQLEKLARDYEQDNQPHVAAALRQRASRLATTDLASEGLVMMQSLGHVAEQPATSASSPPIPARLPDFTSSHGKTRNKASAVRKPHLRIDPPHGGNGTSDAQEPQG